MAKPLQQDEEGRIINDVETEKNQKGYANYEADLKKQQNTRETKEQSMGEKLMKFGSSLLSRPVEKKAKGGSVSSASSRADGCAVKGKTKGRMV